MRISEWSSDVCSSDLRGFLLQGRGGERRGRAALALLAGDVGDVQRAVGRRHDAPARLFGGVAVGDGELFELLAVQAGELGGERLHRSEGRRVGKECVCTSSYRWVQDL